MKNICVIGTGYVGLVSGACLASLGHRVICVDKAAARINSLKKGVMPIFERGLKEVAARAVAAKKLSFSTELGASVERSEVIFITVGTEENPKTGAPELGAVFAAAQEIAAHINGYKAVVLKSTVPPGTAERVRDIIASAAPGAEFALVSNPEFLREGYAVDDFLAPARIIVGADDARAFEIMAQIYKPLTDKGCFLMCAGHAEANIIKYASNAFLAMKITFINELADMCERAGADVGEVAKGMGLDARIGDKFLEPGPGFGGSCLPKDSAALALTAKKLNSPLKLLESVIASNNSRGDKMVSKIAAAFGGELRGKKLAVLGITFKAGTDDMRAAPALNILPALSKLGARLIVYDPQGSKNARALLPGVRFAAGAAAALRGAHGAVILTEWPEFKAITAGEYKTLLKTPIVVDLRNIYELKHMAGLAYHSLGRKTLCPLCKI